MALLPQQTVRTNVLGTEVWITDATGEYSLSNLGGWGVAGVPNPDLSQTALVAYVYRTALSDDNTTSTPTALVPLTSAIAYDVANTNDIVQSIGFSYNTDGHYTALLFAIPVTTDNVATLAGDTIVTDDYFVLDLVVYKRESNGSNTEITDYSLLEDVTSIIKNTTEKMFFNKLSVKKELEYYRQYREARDANDPELAAALRIKMDDLKIDLAGALWLFSAGLYTLAENVVSELLERHEITPP